MSNARVSSLRSMQGEANHNCAIAAVYIKPNGDSANRALFYLYKLLLNQQNRGQLSAGVTTFNHERMQVLDTFKDLGPVNEVFKTSDRQKSIEIFKKVVAVFFDFPFFPENYFVLHSFYCRH